jgi:hypothetical protein
MAVLSIVDRTQKDLDLQAFITAVKTNRWEKSYENSVLNTFTKLRYEIGSIQQHSSFRACTLL